MRISIEPFADGGYVIVGLKSDSRWIIGFCDSPEKGLEIYPEAEITRR